MGKPKSEKVTFCPRDSKLDNTDYATELQYSGELYLKVNHHEIIALIFQGRVAIKKIGLKEASNKITLGD